MFHLENSYVCRKAMERELTLSWPRIMSLWHSARYLDQSPLIPSPFIVEASNKVLKMAEALGSAIWPIPHCIFDRLWVENLQISDFPLPGWIFLRFSPAIWVMLYSQTYTNYMHILAFICRRQFTLGNFFIQATQYCPPVTKKLRSVFMTQP